MNNANPTSPTADDLIASRRERYVAFDRVNRPYLAWQVSQFLGSVGRRVLEIGCGVGSVIELLGPRETIVGLDVVPDVLEVARERFAGRPECRFQLLDLVIAGETELAALERERFDTIICINVLEHIEDDLEALRRMRRIVQPGGTLVLLVPAHQALYGEYDRLDGHYRRYGRRALRRRLEDGGFAVRSIRHFNAIGAVGWWVQYKLLRRTIHGDSQFGLMNLAIPVMRPLERFVAPPFGLSLVAICRREM